MIICMFLLNEVTPYSTFTPSFEVSPFFFFPLNFYNMSTKKLLPTTLNSHFCNIFQKHLYVNHLHFPIGLFSQNKLPPLKKGLVIKICHKKCIIPLIHSITKNENIHFTSPCKKERVQKNKYSADMIINKKNCLKHNNSQQCFGYNNTAFLRQKSILLTTGKPI